MSAVYSAATLYRPDPVPFERFDDAQAAVERLTQIYDRNTDFLRQAFRDVLHGRDLDGRVRAYYPAVRISVQTYDPIDSRLSYGHVAEPGRYQTTITQPALFTDYLIEQIGLLLQNHGVPVEVGESDMPIPLHFAFPEGTYVEGEHLESLKRPLRDLFDVPDLAVTDDAIVNGSWRGRDGEPNPLAPFTATRVDYSLHRLQHYSATAPSHFQNFVLFTNYQFYVDEFCARARALMAQGGGDYDALVEPGNRITRRGEVAAPPDPSQRLPQMPAYHLIRPNHSGITLVNIGVGPSNAKTITDHIAVLRPHAWLMLGHCAGLRDSQRLGDYVLAHGYVRDDHVLDADLPTWVPVPALAEVQVALEQAVQEVAGLSGWDLKRIMRTGTVATIDNRNWELRDQGELVQRFAQSRAIALDMESATIAANGFRFRVPYGTLLCVSDKPLHGELKLPCMASAFYRRQVNQHLEIGIKALELLREMAPERLHSRKLRSFTETAFQ
ncbi:AMP nucleosidase [Bordetella avium]|uniref:AMP nucleosidase n=2 Tax=Bordetella avium TaxID=521 RepID=UPI000E0BFC0E|nr:AMP nucleosidase [Bordetella avium]RIQ12769.1 AMP nucleosidase [Bordetella avium]RIQ37943.1 AMP nucleosidase [Bordetella avium]RIQ41771.1 AMP nucleosidase [Bordetella avium]RIQ43553.1 AMP nucleosidase [Bordetella avium]RIQ48728.1 AMP nucleosidase [Bordetella avium]